MKQVLFKHVWKTCQIWGFGVEEALHRQKKKKNIQHTRNNITKNKGVNANLYFYSTEMILQQHRLPLKNYALIKRIPSLANLRQHV